MRSTVASLCVAVAAACQIPSQPPADLVLRGGKVITLNPQRPVAEAIAIHGERLTAVASAAEIASFIGPLTRIIELEGGLAVPGFIDSHAHFMDLGFTQMRLDLFGTRGPEAIAAMVGDAAGKAPEGSWIQGHGWDQNDWPSKSFPEHSVLDQVAQDRPVVLTRVDMHAAWVNQKALDLAGIDRQTPDPEGGEIVRDEMGIPTGILIDKAMDVVTARMPEPTELERREAFRRAQQACLEQGITGFHDAGVSEPTIELYRRALEQGDLKVRLYVMLAGSDPALLEQYFAHKPPISGRLTVRTVKLLADGALGSRGAAMLKEYSDRPGWTGLMILSEDEIFRIADRALTAGYQLAAHAIGDRTNREVLNAYERAFQKHTEVGDPRFRIEHAQILDPEDIPRFARLGVIAAMQGVHATSDMPWVAERIGEERTAEGAYVWNKLLSAGVRLANGSDAPVESVSVLHGFYASVTREDKNGEPEGGWYPDQRMSREQALRSFTLDAAYAAFEEADKGSLEAGKLADITVLSKDIMTIAPREILSAEVLYTVIGGEVVYQKSSPANP